MDRAYSILTLKASSDDEQRTVEGVASTPETDRQGDVIDPLGIKYTLPLPFLWQHQADTPIGLVESIKRSKDGLTFKARLAKIAEPGPLKDSVDRAWQAIKAGLVKGISVGFRSIERAFMDDGGIHFTACELLEISAVTIAANASANIHTIKNCDAPFLAASGRKNGVVTLSPGASGKPKSISRKEKDVKTIPDQIAEWEAKRAAKTARSEAIMAKSAEEGRTLDEAEAEEHDAISAEVKGIDKHLERLADTQKTSIAKAAPVRGANADEGRESRQPGSGIQVLEPKLEKGIGFARYVMCAAAAKGNLSVAASLAKTYYPNYAPLQDVMKLAVAYGGLNLSTIRKTAVAAGSTSNADHHSALVNYQDLAGEFVEYLRPRTILGQFGTGNIPSLRRVPFNIRVPRQTTKASAGWVGEGKPKPVTGFNTEQITLDFTKAATICVLTDELVRFSTPSAESLVRDELARAIIERIDIDFIDPNNSGTANVKPASITNGAVSIVSTGDTAAAVFVDIQSAFSEFIQANLPLSSAVWIMNANVALALSMMQTSLGNTQFPGITMNGGSFQGIPVIVSQYVPSALVVLAAADQIYLADDGNVTVDASREASIEMLDSSLVQDGIAGTGASLVSLWQTNMVGLRAEREINWRKRNDLSVAYLTSANWGGTAGSGDI